MRVHRNYDQLQLWAAASDLKEFAHAANIVAARLEPVIRQGLAHTILDLVFRAGDRYRTVPMIIIDSPQLVLREADRLVWPVAAASVMDDDACIQIEEFLFPWLRSLSLGRSLDSERIRHFGSQEDRIAFESARAARFAGAALLEDSINALAPYVFGARYALGKNALVCGANDGVQGAAFLSRQALAVSTSELDAAQLDLAPRWFPWPPKEPDFGLIDAAFLGSTPSPDVERRLSRDAVEIWVDHVSDDPAQQRVAAAVYPLDILFTYETLHGPPARNFAVKVPDRRYPQRRVPLEPYIVSGGSAGKLLFGLRRDWQSAPDGDVDSALRLAELLRSEGFTVDVSGEPSACDVASYDVVHCFNLIEAPSAAGFLTKAKAAGVRTVLSAMFLDVAGDQRQWGVETNPVCFRQEMDETSIAGYLSFVERRALLAPGWEEGLRRGPFQNYDAMVHQTLTLADLVIAESNAEAALIKAVGYTGETRVIPPFLPADPIASSARAPLGYGEFALLHAPVEARSNQLFAVRAARDAGVPLVLAGAVRDMEYAARVREAADERVTLLDPNPSELDWLYNSARTIVDFSWYSFGTERLTRALLSGAAVCASSSGWGPVLWPGSVSAVDPAAPRSLAAALASCTPPDRQTADRIAASCAPSALLRNVLAAYVGAQPAPAGT